MTRIRVDFRDANGPCPARACALRRLTDEDDFVLQIDSHTRFRSHWDAYLIDQLAKCDSKEPVLTAYPADYDKDSAALPSDVRPTLLVPSGFDGDGVLRIKGRRLARVHDDRSRRRSGAPGSPSVELKCGAVSNTSRCRTCSSARSCCTRPDCM